MKRAVELFALEARSSRSALVEETFLAESAPAPAFISVATTDWQLVVTRQPGRVRLTVRGPETRATIVPIPRDAEFFGIRFSAGTFLPGLPPGRLVDRAVDLPASAARFWLAGSAWELPGPDSADASSTGWCGRGCWCTTRSWPRRWRATSPGSPPGRWSGGWPGRRG